MPVMPIADLYFPADTEPGLNIPHLTGPEIAQTVSVLAEAAKATEVFAQGRRDSSSSRLGTPDSQDDLLTPGQAQPWDY